MIPNRKNCLFVHMVIGNQKTKWSEKTNYPLIDAFNHALLKDETLAEIKKWNAFNMMEEKK